MRTMMTLTEVLGTLTALWFTALCNVLCPHFDVLCFGKVQWEVKRQKPPCGKGLARSAALQHFFF